MDSPRVAPPLHHGIDRNLPHGQPPPDPTPATSHIHRRLAADEKRRWDVDGKLVFELMFWCAHEKFEFSPPHLPLFANRPTLTSHPIRLWYPLEYIIEEGKTKYEGKKWLASLFDRYFSITHLSHIILLLVTWRHPSTCPTDTTNTPPNPSIPSNTSTLRWRWNMKVLGGREGASWRGESWSDVFDLSFQHLTSACWLLLWLCKQTIRNNQPPEKPNDENKNKHTTINPRMILCPRQEELVSCFSCIRAPKEIELCIPDRTRKPTGLFTGR
jgi:hypothetical protein